MLAFLMNGEPLHPDHGYPVRLLIPGYIGGRMIKWLSTISVTKEEGENWYHVYDNRVFPKHVVSRDAAMVETEPERAGDFGLRYCWVLWELEVDVDDLAKTPEIAVRCWDGQNTQPDWPTWNLMGMMNNPWFRVRIHVVPGKDRRADGFLWCEHPTRVESSGPTWNENANTLTIAYQKENLHVLENGHLGSKGWMEENLAQVQEWYAPKAKERLGEQADAVELKQRKMSKEATPEALPAARRIPTECFAGLPPVTVLDENPAVAW